MLLIIVCHLIILMYFYAACILVNEYTYQSIIILLSIPYQQDETINYSTVWEINLRKVGCST